MSSAYLNRRLLAAVHDGSLAKSSQLLALDADPNTISGFHSPLTLAASENHADIVKALVGAGARVNERVKGYSALHWAAGLGAESFDVLLELGADASIAAPGTGSTPAHIAAAAGNAHALRKLADMGAPLETLDAEGNAPLHIAAVLDSDLATKALLESGVSPSIRDTRGRVPLHVARKEQAAALLAFGADPEALDAEGKSPAETAPLTTRALITSHLRQSAHAHAKAEQVGINLGKGLGS